MERENNTKGIIIYTVKDSLCGLFNIISISLLAPSAPSWTTIFTSREDRKTEKRQKPFPLSRPTWSTAHTMLPSESFSG